MPEYQEEHNNNNDWTEVLEPKKGVFQMDVKEVWHYRDLLVMFIKREFVATYKQTILGPLWFFIQPLLTTFIFTLIFGKFAGISTEGLPYIAFYLSGLIIWNYFADCLNRISTTFTANTEIFSKVYFPRIILPLSVIISGMVRFLIQFSLFLLVLLYFSWKGGSGISPNSTMILTPLLIFLMAGYALGLGMIFTSLTTKYRDLNNLLSFGIQLLMYVTPVIYPLNSLSEKYRTLASINPLSPVVESFRYAYLGKGYFTGEGLLYSFVIMLIILTIGVLIFNRVERNFIDTI